jgi:hypothetical protein
MLNLTKSLPETCFFIGPKFFHLTRGRVFNGAGAEFFAIAQEQSEFYVAVARYGLAEDAANHFGFCISHNFIESIDRHPRKRRQLFKPGNTPKVVTRIHGKKGLLDEEYLFWDNQELMK